MMLHLKPVFKLRMPMLPLAVCYIVGQGTQAIGGIG